MGNLIVTIIADQETGARIWITAQITGISIESDYSIFLAIIDISLHDRLDLSLQDYLMLQIRHLDRIESLQVRRGLFTDWTTVTLMNRLFDTLEAEEVLASIQFRPLNR